MQVWKIGLFAVPAFAGFAFGIKQATQLNSENDTIANNDAPPKTLDKLM